MNYANPDNRADYPVHLTKRSPGKNKESRRLFYECRVYDKYGNLLRIVMRPPIDFENEPIALKGFDRLFTVYPEAKTNFIKKKKEK